VDVDVAVVEMGLEAPTCVRSLVPKDTKLMSPPLTMASARRQARGTCIIPAPRAPSHTERSG
jgi:hypothetical protein